jgi:hypothetical protein
MVDSPQPPVTLSLVGRDHLRPQLEAKLAENRHRAMDGSLDATARAEAANRAAVLSRLLAVEGGIIGVETTKKAVRDELGLSYSGWHFANAVNAIQAFIEEAEIAAALSDDANEPAPG